MKLLFEFLKRLLFRQTGRLIETPRMGNSDSQHPFHLGVARAAENHPRREWNNLE